MSNSSLDQASTTPAPPCVGPVPASDPNEWFAQEVHAHDGQLKAYLRGQFPTVRDVEDVVQESYLKIWKARAVHPIECARAFLFKVARHLALDVVRRERRAPVDFQSSPDDSLVLDSRPNAVETLLTHETLEILAHSIACLPAKERAVILLHKVNGRTQKETAAELDLPVRTVEKYTLQGLKRCQAYLVRYGIERFFD
ncbi:MAG TPA: RNA polymerase sigma factor [Opitutaceae bacterium]|nr:RNA polymerase sigma factor [Opitutaceae bacterium]